MDYKPAELRRFLFERFDDEELKQLCFDYFADVYHDFTSSMRKSQMVQLLLEHCQKQGRFPALLAALERERPEAYAEAFPATEQLEVKAPAPIARNPRRVFISCAHQDGEFGQRLASDLRRHGLPVWIAPDSIRPGEKWVEAINRGLSECGVFALALTPNAAASSWVNNEVNVAIQLANEGSVRFIPLNVRPAEPPPLWRAYQYISFETSYEQGLKELLAQLGVTPAEPERESPVETGRDGRTQTDLPPRRQLPRWVWAAAVGIALVIAAILLVQTLSPDGEAENLPVASVTEAGSTRSPTQPLTAGPSVTAPTTASPVEATPLSSASIDTGELRLWPGFLESQYFQGEIRLGETVTVDRLPPGDVQTWLFRGGPVVARISLDGSANVDFLLRVYGEQSLNWDDIYPRGYVNFNSAGPSETLDFFEFPDSGDYIVAISGASGLASRYELTIAEAVRSGIGFSETVEESVVGDNPAVYDLPAGPATIDITLQMGAGDAALLMLFDALGNQLAYIDQVGEDGTITLTNVAIPDGERYAIVIRDVNNDGAQYRLSTAERSE